MSACALHNLDLPRGNGIHVNGVPVPRDRIAREAQNHPARAPGEAWRAAARSLVIRELLLQEARRLRIRARPIEDDAGRRETEEEASIRTLIEQEVTTPEPDAATCRRYYETHREAFSSPVIYEAAHILFAARRDDAAAFRAAGQAAQAALLILAAEPARFAELAEAHSACTSAAQGGNLGQLTPGQTTPEFEAALGALAVGGISQTPVETRYGLHIIRLDRRIEGRELPFEIVAGRIGDYLRESVTRRATAQYIARLAARAQISGIALTSAEELRVN